MDSKGSTSRRIRVLVGIAALLALGSGSSQAALSFRQLDEAASEFALKLSSSAAGLALKTGTLHVADLEPAVYSPALLSAPRAFQEFLKKRVLDTHSFILMEDPDSQEKADYILLSSLIEVDDNLMASIRLVDRMTRTLLVAEQRAFTEVAPPVIADRQGSAIPGHLSTGLSRGHWLTYGGFSRLPEGGGKAGWSAGLAFRRASQRWQAGLEIGRYRHRDNRVTLISNNEYRQQTTVDVEHVTGRIQRLIRIEAIKDPRGEIILRFPGFLKIGTGLGIYNIREELTTKGINVNFLDSTNVTWHTRVAPSVDLSLVRSIGSRVELQISGEFVLFRERFGVQDYRPGGLSWGAALAYRLR